MTQHETSGPLIIPDRTPSFSIGKPRAGAHVIMRDTPRLPEMPNMLPDDPAEAAVTAAALKAMMGTDFKDDSRTKALGAAVRVIVFGTVALVTATMAWGVMWMMAGVGVEWLPVAWLGALLGAMIYLIISEGASHKYSAAGIEHAKIGAATQMHYDRLEARKEMHKAAVEAWENVLVKGLDKWGSGE